MAKKKLFISCPMKGRTEENIKNSMTRMHKMAELIFDQELEVIESYIEDNPPANSKQAIWFLGKSIQLLSEADYFIGIQYSEYYRGCHAEASIARDYGIKCTYVDITEMMPDAAEIERDYYNSLGNEPVVAHTALL